MKGQQPALSWSTVLRDSVMSSKVICDLGGLINTKNRTVVWETVLTKVGECEHHKGDRKSVACVHF